MARIRTIKPETPQSESLGRVSREARLCFILLFTQADDAGRLRGNSRMLASLLFPYDDDAKDLIDGWLNELQQARCIRRYEVGGDHFIDIPKWLEHQKIDHPSTSKIPEFAVSSRTISKPRETSLRIKDQGREGIKDQGCASATDEFESWYSKYPRKVGRALACKAFKTASKKTDLDTLKAGLDRYCAEVAGKDQGFIAHPATWLNGERWLDEPGSNTAPQSPPMKANGNGHSPGGGIADSAQTAADVRRRRAERIKDGDPKGGTNFMIPKSELQRMLSEGLLTMADLEHAGLAA